ncbi:MAG: class I adenylate-forming enzyme family protein, partial [bacterium]
DPNGNPLPAGEKGEIVIRGHNVMMGYFSNPEANAQTFTYGWFRSGDEGFWLPGPDGIPYFFITGRLKELIIRGGVNISPLEIDEVLMAIPGVKTGIAVGFTHELYGEEVGAYVQLEDNSSLTPEEIIARCREKLPFFKCPKVVLLGNSIPVTSTGKYQRNRLKPLFASYRNTHFKES